MFEVCPHDEPKNEKQNPNVKLFLNFGSEGRVKNKRLNIEGM